MRKKKYEVLIILVAALFISPVAYTQTTSLVEIERFVNAQSIDVTSRADLDTLAKIIRNHYSDSLSRVKAAYTWTARNITYSEEGTDSRLRHTATNIDSVLKYKSSVCAGYVNVFCLLCEKTGITCKEVDGFGRSGTQPFLNAHFAVNHAWAAVWLTGKWNLADVTWGSGYTLEGTNNFISAVNDYYFFTEPETFILDHYPKQTGWQLLKDTISWSQFINYPGICIGAKENEISNCQPAQSLLHTAAGDRIQFSFVSKKPLQSIVIYSKQKGLQEQGILQKKNDTYYYNYTIPAAGQYDLVIDLNNYDITKPGTYSSLVDFVYFVDATAKK